MHHDDSIIWVVLALSKAARVIESSGNDVAILQTGTALEAALNTLGLPTRPPLRIVGKWASSSEILAALLVVDGGGVSHHAAPRTFSTDLLGWFVTAAEAAGNRWLEGERELTSRSGRQRPNTSAHLA
jgi:hypothetical protein